MTFVSALLGAHLSCAAGATFCFWLTALAEKGRRLHRASGFWFARLVYITAATGAALAVLRLSSLRNLPQLDARAAALEAQVMWLVLYVLLIIVVPVQHGIAVVAAAATPRVLRSSKFYTFNALSILGAVLIFVASLQWRQWQFLIVAPIGLIVGLRNLRYAGRAAAARVDWEREHLTSQLTAGITLHTALLVFGTSRTLGLQLTGLASLWPWTLPALVGLPVIVWWRRARARDLAERTRRRA